MIPPSPLPFPLWGSIVCVELTAGLWRALAAPWLTPGWPAPPGAAPRPPADRHAGAAAAADGAARPAGAGSAAPRYHAGPGGGGQVIRVPPARWRERRG